MRYFQSKICDRIKSFDSSRNELIRFSIYLYPSRKKNEIIRGGTVDQKQTKQYNLLQIPRLLTQSK